MYQLALTEEPSYYDHFTAADWREFERRKKALQAIYDEAQEYGASIEACNLWSEFQKAMKVNHLPQPARTPRVTVREVTHDPLVARPSWYAVFVCRLMSVLF